MGSGALAVRVRQLAADSYNGERAASAVYEKPSAFRAIEKHVERLGLQLGSRRTERERLRRAAKPKTVFYGKRAARQCIRFPESDGLRIAVKGRIGGRR